MTSSYRDPNITAALAYQAEQEQRRKAQEQPSFLDIAGRTALGLGVAALAGAGIARGLRRNAVRPITVQDLGAEKPKKLCVVQRVLPQHPLLLGPLLPLA
jgi:TnpA family transposase